MKVVISEVMPTVHHALCIWHIGQNLLHNLNLDINGDKSLFFTEFHHCVDDIPDVDEFVVYWNNMAERYGLNGHPWLERMRIAHRVIGYEDEVFEGVCRIIDSAHSYMDKHITFKDKGKETISPALIDPVTVQNGVVGTGLKKKISRKSPIKRRRVPWTESEKAAKRLRAVKKRIIKKGASFKVNEEQLYRDKPPTHLTL